MWGIYETREQELRHSVMSYLWVRRHFGAIRNHFVTICDDCSKFRAKREGMRHAVMSRVEFQAIRDDSAKFWISYDDLDWVRVGFKALRWSRGDLGTIESQFSMIWWRFERVVSDKWWFVKLYGVRGQLCRIDGELKAFCGDLDQICGVAGSFEAICRSVSKFRSGWIKLRKLSGIVVMWSGISSGKVDRADGLKLVVVAI